MHVIKRNSKFPTYTNHHSDGFSVVVSEMVLSMIIIKINNIIIIIIYNSMQV